MQVSDGDPPPATQLGDVPNVFIVTDPGNDYDDIMALLILAHHHILGEINLVGIIATLDPAEKRAGLVHGLLTTMNISGVPVAVGTKGSDRAYKVADYEFPKSWKRSNSDLWDYLKLAEQVFVDAHRNNEKIRLLSIASLRDTWKVIDTFQELFVQVVSDIHVQGGCVVQDGNLRPDKAANNNTFDMDAATAFYEFLQTQDIPCTVYTKKAAKESAFFFQDLQKATSASERMNDVMVYLNDCHLKMNQRYWNCAQDPALRFRPDLDEQWFFETRTKGLPDNIRNNKEEQTYENISPYVVVSPNDPLVALGCIGFPVASSVRRLEFDVPQGTKRNANVFMVDQNVNGERVESMLIQSLRASLEVE